VGTVVAGVIVVRDPITQVGYESGLVDLWRVEERKNFENGYRQAAYEYV
jgi:hypothetical protein